MPIDLFTLYCLLVGTLLVGGATMLWERHAHPHRARELGGWAAGFGFFAAGCVVGLNRGHLPVVVGPALANILFVLGYLLVLHGAACLDGPRRPLRSLWLLPALAVVWATVGSRFPDAVWTYVASAPIAVVCGLTAIVLWRSRTAATLRSRPVAVAISAIHGFFYAVRALVMPAIVAYQGPALLPWLAKFTIYEGVLYSVALPMSLVALVREEAQHQLLEAARTDYLTGLGNRQRFFERGTQLMDRRPPGQPFCLMAFDLDHFKSINDRHGHAAGDGVLKLFAAVLRDVAGPQALLARLGGEEFAALLPNHDTAAARGLAAAIARTFTGMVERPDGPGIPATVSIGLAEATSPRDDLERVLSAADRALYLAKARGRNRIEASGTG